MTTATDTLESVSPDFNAVWKRICMAAERFHAAATAMKRLQGCPDRSQGQMRRIAQLHMTLTRQAGRRLGQEWLICGADRYHDGTPRMMCHYDDLPPEEQENTAWIVRTYLSLDHTGREKVRAVLDHLGRAAHSTLGALR